jgi:tetratricopeptide (TPR) repeat protein
MDRGRLDSADRERWYHARGIVEYRTHQHERARQIFAEGLGTFPDSGWLNYGLGQEYEYQGRVDEMARCFGRVRLGDVGGAALLAIARYYYLWDRYQLGQQTIQPIFHAYYQLKIVDDTFLYLRGLPSFDEAFGYRTAFALLMGRLDEARAELAHARADLSDGSFDHLALTLEATASGDWEPVLSDLEKRIAPAPAGFPSGTHRMRRAVLRSRKAPTVGAARAELDTVQLGPDDHAWLADIRTLARAEAAHRLGDRPEEEAALAEFWPKQGLLFEPNHAFNFGFLAYQETLKPTYRGQRRG